MRVHLTVRHFEMNPEDRLFAEQRLEKLSRFNGDVHEVHVTVTAEKYRHMAEIILRLPGREVVSREEATEAKTALERAADRLEQQLRRLKERRVERQRGDRSRTADAMTLPVEPPADEWEEHGGVAGEE